MNVTKYLWCAACGDSVTAAYPCKFVFFDGRVVELNICPECMKTGTLTLDLPRLNFSSIILTSLGAKKKWENVYRKWTNDK